MSTATHLLGNEIALEDSIAKIQRALSEAGFTIVEQTWLNPIANVWSVHLHDHDCLLLSANGVGASKQAALANAISKFCSYLSTHYFWSDWYLGDEIANNKLVHFPQERWFTTNPNGTWPDGVLNEQLQDFYNQDGELNASSLIDTNSANLERGICCIPYYCQSTGDEIYFPLNIVDNLYASNGIAAGDSLEEARLNGLLDILQNFVKYKVIASGEVLPNIPESILVRYPSCIQNIKEIEAAGYSIQVKDASFGGKYPVLVAILFNPKNQNMRLGFSSNSNFEIALEQCFSNLLKGQRLDQLELTTQADFDMDAVASPENLAAHFTESKSVISWQALSDNSDHEFVHWDENFISDNNTEVFDQLSKIIRDDDFEIYISDDAGVGIHTCRILIPGMSEIYPVDNLVWENNNAGIELRGQIVKSNKSQVECQELIEDLEDLNLADEYLVSELMGMPSDIDCIFADLTIAELVTLLALKTQDNERIQEGCEWLIHYQKLDAQRLKTYQCIDSILQLDGMTNYAAALENLYTRPILNDALALIAGEDIFPLRSDWKSHKQLIESYKKLTRI